MLMNDRPLYTGGNDREKLGRKELNKSHSIWEVQTQSAMGPFEEQVATSRNPSHVGVSSGPIKMQRM